VALPLNTLLNAEQYAYILADSRTSAIVASASLAKTLLPILDRVPRLRTIILVGSSADNRAAFAAAGRNLHDFSALVAHAAIERKMKNAPCRTLDVLDWRFELGVLTADSIAITPKPFKPSHPPRLLERADHARKRAVTSAGIGRDFIFNGSAGSRAAQTRVSCPSTATVAPTKSRCSTSKLERRNSRTWELSSTWSPKCAGARKRAGIDQGQPGNAKRRCELGRLHAEGGLEQHPGAPVEKLEKSAVEDDAGRVAMAPLDGKAPPVNQFSHYRKSWPQT
jgi:hypothetical protein